MAPAPFSLVGSLSEFEWRDETPNIGTLFPDSNVQLAEILVRPDSDTLIRDLATLVSHRGVVFFKRQNLDPKQLKELGTRLGELSGKPKSSTLHKHPISESLPELGADISVISSQRYVPFFLLSSYKFMNIEYSVSGIARADYVKGGRASNGWHTDITFEKVPSDYTVCMARLLC